MPKTHDPPQEQKIDDDRAIATRDVAKLLGMAEITVHQARARGEGPAYFRTGPNGRSIRYIRRDVLAWRDARRVGGGER